jgi:hypothetical protein
MTLVDGLFRKSRLGCADRSRGFVWEQENNKSWELEGGRKAKVARRREKQREPAVKRLASMMDLEVALTLGFAQKMGPKHCTAWEIELAGLSCLSTHAGLLLTDRAASKMM